MYYIVRSTNSDVPYYFHFCCFSPLGPNIFHSNTFSSLNLCSFRRPKCSVIPYKQLQRKRILYHARPNSSSSSIHSILHITCRPIYDRTEGNSPVLLRSIREARTFQFGSPDAFPRTNLCDVFLYISFSHTMSRHTPNDKTKHSKHAVFMDGSCCVPLYHYSPNLMEGKSRCTRHVDPCPHCNQKLLTLSRRTLLQKLIVAHPMDSILSQFNPVHALIPYINTTFASMLKSPKLPKAPNTIVFRTRGDDLKD
jgi:hypothetical protein